MTVRDLYTELSELKDEFPESWIPDVGDIIVGPIEYYTSGTTQHGTYHIAVVKDELKDELRSVWLMHKVLRGEFERLKPLVGERIGIKRLPDSRNDYKRFSVKVDRNDSEQPDLGPFAAADDASPEERSEPDGGQPQEPDDDLPF